MKKGKASGKTKSREAKKGGRKANLDADGLLSEPERVSAKHSYVEEGLDWDELA
jgi:hypothetical protein